jgi:hypothetical protein
VKIADEPTSNDWVAGVADRVTMKISTTTNAAPTNSSNQSMVGTVVSAATSLVSRAVEMLPTCEAMLVAAAEFEGTRGRCVALAQRRDEIAERLVDLRRPNTVVPHRRPVIFRHAARVTDQRTLNALRSAGKEFGLLECSADRRRLVPDGGACCGELPEQEQD